MKKSIIFILLSFTLSAILLSTYLTHKETPKIILYVLGWILIFKTADKITDWLTK